MMQTLSESVSASHCLWKGTSFSSVRVCASDDDLRFCISNLKNHANCMQNEATHVMNGTCAMTRNEHFISELKVIVGHSWNWCPLDIGFQSPAPSWNMSAIDVQKQRESLKDQRLL